jgi:hypothetical protein
LTTLSQIKKRRGGTSVSDNPNDADVHEPKPAKHRKGANAYIDDFRAAASAAVHRSTLD